MSVGPRLFEEMCEEYMINCPKCSSEALVETPALGNIPLDICPGCSGIWFSKGELEALLKQSQGNSLTDLNLINPKAEGLVCPGCKNQMSRGGLVNPLLLVDRCPSCGGVWLDPRELHLARKLLGLSGGPSEVKVSRPVAPTARSGITVSIYIIIASNLFPIVMVAGGSWGIREILTLYWFEAAIIGFFNIFKILLAFGPPAKLGGELTSRFTVVTRFIICFGALMYWTGYCGQILGSWFRADNTFNFYQLWEGVMPDSYKINLLGPLLNVKWAALILLARHAESFVINYIYGGEYKRSTPAKLMMQPFPHIIVMLLTIYCGALFTFFFLNLGVIMVIFIAIKIFTDLYIHLNEHT